MRLPPRPAMYVCRNVPVLAADGPPAAPKFDGLVECRGTNHFSIRSPRARSAASFSRFDHASAASRVPLPSGGISLRRAAAPSRASSVPGARTLPGPRSSLAHPSGGFSPLSGHSPRRRAARDGHSAAGRRAPGGAHAINVARRRAPVADSGRC